MQKRPNVLLLTVDDLNYNSLGCFGCPVEGVSPNIDQLASEGMKFENSFVAIAVCQPSRSVLLTGRYPNRNGAKGFEDIDASVTTLTEQLKKYGYYNGIIGKEDHVAPSYKFKWDQYIATYNDENNWGRDPENYYGHVKNFLKGAKDADKPFFLMANSHDPHRPFAGSDDEIPFFGRHIDCDFHYNSEDVNVPGSLADLPKVRQEMAQYYSSVRRGDQIVGKILQALKEAGVYDDTIILFLSDNGMALPFSKTNCYLNSTKSPYIMRYPKYIKGGSVSNSLISSIDYAPTILEMLNIPQILEMDGKSFLHCLTDNDEQYEDILTFFYKTSANEITGVARHYPMRAVQTKEYTYIYNSWSDNNTVFLNESMTGLTFKAMEEAGETDQAIKDRVEFYKYRVKEELYCSKDDINALDNILDDEKHSDILCKLRKRMGEYMLQSGDGLYNQFYEDVLSKIK